MNKPLFCAVCHIRKRNLNLSFEIGNEFIANEAEKPDGFCSWAWGDIEKTVAVLALGGDVYWNKYKGTAVVCCTDAIRPVVFKLERMQ